MSHPDFIVLVQKIYRCLLNGVEGLQLQGAIIVEVLSALGCAKRFTPNRRYMLMHFADPDRSCSKM